MKRVESQLTWITYMDRIQWDLQRRLYPLNTRHSKPAGKFLLQKTATAMLPDITVLCGELIPIMHKAGCEARKLMDPRVATKH